MRKLINPNYYIILLLLFFATYSDAQINPPCQLSYGTSENEANISYQMRYGTIAAATEAISQAKNSRGLSLGCPEVALSYSQANITEPALSEILAIWNANYIPVISSYVVDCPRIGRYENNAALAAYYAMQAGYFSDLSKLNEISNMMYDQQYSNWNIASPQARNEGVFAYLNTSQADSCYQAGVVGTSVTELCSALPQYCVTYTGGQFSGRNFATSGQDDANGLFDGGLAYDHGWAAVQMIEAAISQNDPELKQKYRNSAILAGQFALSEHSVKNHNYTAKLIWLLAQLYAWTGEEIYKDELNKKLNKNLIPGVLWDADNDGNVDGVSPAIAFDDLTSIAQQPGRMWDGHNSTAWYQAINAWALAESYIAFRDRGDVLRANEIRPYVIAMLDNLSQEILTKGVVSPNQLGVRDITYALLTGIWKIAQYEAEAHQEWKNAAWAMWNSGYFNSYSTHAVNMGLYLNIKSNTPYQALAKRESFELSSNIIQAGHSALWYDPNQSGHGINVYLLAENRILVFWYVYDHDGNPIWLLAVGTHDGKTAQLDVTSHTGGLFPPSFDPNDVISEPWGKFELEFVDCNQGVFRWIPISGSGFDTGEMNITRLIYTLGLSCAE